MTEMLSDRIRQLLQKFFNDQCTPQERQELALWSESVTNDPEWESLLEEIRPHFQSDENIDSEQAEAIVRNIIEKDSRQQIAPPKRKSLATSFYRFSLLAGAAIAVLLVLSIGYVRKNFGPAMPVSAVGYPTDMGTVHPGGNRAVLVLADGTTISLDRAKNGALAQLGGTQVRKPQSGQLVYKGESTDATQKDDVGEALNTLRTPVGGQYQIVLADGSKVWLNAASELIFPTAFTGDRRRVDVRGEAYFKIKPDSKHPFVVTIHGEQGAPVGNILVADSRFNVSAYPDEPNITITLLEGMAKVSGTDGQGSAKKTQSKKALQLSAGQQALIGEKGETRLSKVGNRDAVIAWKNGRFAFGGIDMAEVMRQLSRWYNIDVQYTDTLSTHFIGTISRNAELSDVLKMLELTGDVHFIAKGRTVIVSR